MSETFPTNEVRPNPVSGFPLPTGRIGDIVGRVIDHKNKILRFPTDNLDKNHGWIIFTEIKEELDPDSLIRKKVVQSFRDTNTIALYLPKEGLSVGDGAKYDDAQLGFFGKNIENVNLKEVDPMVVLTETGKALTDVAQVFTGNTRNIGIITKVLQQTRLANQPVGQAIRSRLGRTANPHLRAVFTQVDRRTFNYQFELVPNNPREAKNIKEIVKFFRANLYPEVEGFEDFVYKFPNKFDISYYFNNKRIGHKIKPCYLTSVKTVFNNQGSMTFYPDGEFLSTKIELTFTEERTITRKDVLDTSEDGIGY